MSNNQNTIVLASGIVVGVATIYALREKIEFSDVIEKLEGNQNIFTNLVKNILELGKELLEKLYHWIQEFIRELIFKFNLIKSNIKKGKI